MNKYIARFWIVFVGTMSFPIYGNSCANIKKACLGAGFKDGGIHEGLGLRAHCINPIIQGVAHPPGAKKPLPEVALSEVENCKKKSPTFGRGAVGSEIQLPAPEATGTQPPPSDGSGMKIKKTVTYSATSAIKYYKFIKTTPLPQGTSYLSKLTGKVRLDQNGVYTLSLNSIMITPKCPVENQVPFINYDKTFYNYLGPVRYNLAQFILRGTSQSQLNFKFPSPIPVSGCLIVLLDGGPLSGTSTFKMTADLALEFDQSDSAKHARNPVLLSTGTEFSPDSGPGKTG